MPIAYCFVRNRELTPERVQPLAHRWASIIDVDPKDITLSFLPVALQVGQPYTIMVQLLLPSLWHAVEVDRIQRSLAHLLGDAFDSDLQEIFITTMIIASGHVVENGETVTWPVRK